MITPTPSPQILTTDEVLNQVKMWKDVETTCKAANPLIEESLECAILRSPTSECVIKISELAKLLLVKPTTIHAWINIKKVELLTSQLAERFNNPFLHIINSNIPPSLSSNWLQIVEKLRKTFQQINPMAGLQSNKGFVSHYKRSVHKTDLPINIDEQGRSFAIVKVNKTSEPFADGLEKKLYFAVDLHYLKPAAWAKIAFRSGAYSSLDEFLKSKKSEITIQSSFNSPVIVQIYHWCTYIDKNNGIKVGIMMEYCDHDMLKYLCKIPYNRNDPKVQLEMWNILEDICLALAQLEERGIHHRDLKPDNIFLVKTADGYRAKLGDFGFATHINDEISDPAPCGTPEYLSPEFVRGHISLRSVKDIIDSCTQFIQSTKKRKLDSRECKEEVAQDKTPNLFLLESENREKHRLKEVEAELENARIVYKNGCSMAANTKGDVWALGLILFIMRTRISPGIFLFGEDTTSWPAPQVINEIAKLSQEKVDSSFSAKSPQDILNDLNQKMLRMDPKERITAKDCLAEVRELRRANAPFM